MSSETETLDRSSWPGEAEPGARPGPRARGRAREPAPALPVAGSADATMQLDRQLALCRRQRTVLSIVDVLVERIEVDGAAPSAQAAREVHDEVAHRMRGRVRSTDGVMRQSERQACAFLCGGTPETARRVAERYAQVLNGAYRLGSGRAEVVVRIGFAGYPQDGVRAAELLQRAAARRTQG